MPNTETLKTKYNKPSLKTNPLVAEVYLPITTNEKLYFLIKI